MNTQLRTISDMRNQRDSTHLHLAISHITPILTNCSSMFSNYHYNFALPTSYSLHLVFNYLNLPRMGTWDVLHRSYHA